MSQTLIPTIGIETHVQLKTRSKLFCGCSNDARTAGPNTLICPVCLGLPGTLPVLNFAAVKLALRAGLALNAQIATRTKFDRKNYFYPDLPKGYQVTQFDQPIVGPGRVRFPLAGREVSVGITRAHLEEDAGKLTHPAGADYSLVDLNRAGTPLMEVVSEPDMHSAAEAKAYAQEIYNLMRYADVSDADLYFGNMRFDVNVSLAPAGQRGTRTETKNLNSFRSVERSVEYEIKRQTELLAKGQPVVQETRGWDEAKGQTFAQRSKEEAHDYRYFPEPDLPPIVVTPELLAEAKQSLPLMPNQLRAKFTAQGLNPNDVGTLVGQPLLSALFLGAAERLDPAGAKRVAGWLVGEVQAKLASGETSEQQISAFQAVRLVELAELVGEGALSSTAAKQVLGEMLKTGDEPRHLAETLKLLQVSDSGQIEAAVDEVIAKNPKIVADFKSGNDRALQALVGQVMKASKGQANPPMVNDILKKKLT